MQQKFDRERRELEQAHLKIVKQMESRLYELESVNKVRPQLVRASAAPFGLSATLERWCCMAGVDDDHDGVRVSLPLVKQLNVEHFRQLRSFQFHIQFCIRCGSVACPNLFSEKE